MSVAILHDSEVDRAVITLFDVALPVVFAGNRDFALTARETADWFLKRCRHHTALSELVESGQIGQAYLDFRCELTAAGAARRALRSADVTDEVVLEAAFLGKLTEYVSAATTLTDRFGPAAIFALNEAIEANHWEIECAVSDAETSVKGMRP